ncbi:DnaJ domain-containing protein [Rhizobium grahamii]|uniref:DnaJ domain-containing protein n=1 Tax=Rhizobium grahamii TaxID=1120045 RepID=A0A5Q0C1Z5_9HYPH|nr:MULTISPECIES: DnaJ C-terminal domain-containing protein [Rhizobium]QFY59275.1 DnaJ domain-containing protein [Rhizobium grahamii]QRM48197.1 DnaJ domain-containing protein [Rhizobium sp. BG6]
MRDPYKILGVKRDAGQDEIKAAWRNMAKAVHPDHNQGDPTASARFAEVGRAYETLKDPKKRSLFDNAARMAEAKSNENTIMAQRQAAREAAVRAKAAQENAERVMEELARAAAQKAAADAAKQQQTGAAEPAEEMIERIFGAQARAAGGGSRTAYTAASRKADAEPAVDKQPDTTKTEAETMAEDAATASILQPLSLLTSLVRRFTGSAAPAPEKVPDLIATATVTVDDVLKGSWTLVDLGEGREVGFTLAPGTTEGHQVRLKGQGHKLSGMQRGDALINVHIAPDTRFKVDGFDLHAVLPVTIENAVLGTDAEIEGPNGPLKITVPAWSGSDKTIRIAGQGLADGAGGRGDLVVELRIILWEKPDDKVTDLMRSMKNGLFL